ncbi:hypothetical protein BDV37DRAFT_264870 [Aspergillus pseudonomiae]|uniref:Secreted protein n=1 Tax=Aspergillus pseudonomiae TaxID=1506151 RepID=A0A5N7CUI0_9EURO|nr:uncharacterized protein BDV37DRAFT_264870 [Aspergillus pseudonomiae]KAE8397781.1 hypothetical protein BDV37DRAFT_264870 [Aspergillus pseudonomiae]
MISLMMRTMGPIVLVVGYELSTAWWFTGSSAQNRTGRSCPQCVPCSQMLPMVVVLRFGGRASEMWPVSQAGLRRMFSPCYKLRWYRPANHGIWGAGAAWRRFIILSEYEAVIDVA